MAGHANVVMWIFFPYTNLRILFVYLERDLKKGLPPPDKVFTQFRMPFLEDDFQSCHFDWWAVAEEDYLECSKEVTKLLAAHRASLESVSFLSKTLQHVADMGA